MLNEIVRMELKEIYIDEWRIMNGIKADDEHELESFWQGFYRSFTSSKLL
jgi:hypothetical protein